MNKIEVIQFFSADSAVLFFHVRIISRTPWTNFRYKGYFCRLIGQRQRITYLFAFTPGLCIIQVNGGSYSIKKNVFLIEVSIWPNFKDTPLAFDALVASVTFAATKSVWAATSATV